ncbi:MAG TPA: hypothetical protein VFA60_12035 [Terriglobales bacterium]|nr:hypothetical protein [Terriglobales bacterium]
MRASAVLLCASLLPVTPALSQERNNEVGLLLGAIKTPDTTARLTAPATAPVRIGTGLSLQATYARKLTSSPRAAVYLEVPFVATPSTDVSSPFTAAPRNYASLFITPGVRVAFAPNSGISPWLAVGGGYARFDESSTRIDGAPNASPRGANSGAAQFGGGVDFKTPVKILFPIGLRAEVRDFYSNQPNFGAPTDDRQHNVVFSGGIVLKF